MSVSFDWFGTLVTVNRPAEPWVVVADAFRERDRPVPDDWETAYRTAHREYERGSEVPLDEHVRLALASRGVDIEPESARELTLGAFDGPVVVRDGAEDALEAARSLGPVGICSNCSVPGLVEQTRERSGLSVDAVVTSVGCEWRKPHPRIFEATAAALDTDLTHLVHVGDDARTDGGAGRAGGTSMLLDDVSLPAFPAWLDREGPS